MSVILAHAGHWSLYVLYAVPVIVVVVTIAVGMIQERRRRSSESPAEKLSRSPSP